MSMQGKRRGQWTTGVSEVVIASLVSVAGGADLGARLSQTDELLRDLQKSVNTNYNKQKEIYKNKKKLATV